eukprot:gene3384-3608_t
MTSLDEIVTIRNRLNAKFYEGKTRPYEYRLKQLKSLQSFLKKEEKAIFAALAADLHKSTFEAFLMELGIIAGELDYIIANLKDWLKPEYTPVPAAMAPAYSEVHKDPYGVTLIVVPFNYPVQLALSPLFGAIAGGNCVVLKPNELATETEKLLSQVLPMYLDQETFAVVTGDAKVSADLLTVRWDKIFFTGSTRVGKLVMKAASEFLTPVSLELGGKSPTIVDKNLVDLDTVAKRIVWGKTMNSGQTCVAPDYIYIHEDVYDAVLKAMKEQAIQFYSEHPKDSPDLSRIISAGHFQRLKKLLDDSKQNVYYGGNTDEKTKYIDFTILTNVTHESKVMEDEIFGPLLPVFKYKDINEVIRIVNKNEKPLVMYLFSSDLKWINRLINAIPSGDVVTNDTLLHAGSPFLPFGGVGASGMGGYHGKFSIDAFTFKRTVLRRDATKILDAPIRYPPYSDFKFGLIKSALNLPPLPGFTPKFKVYALFFSLVVAAGVALGVYYGKYN